MGDEPIPPSIEAMAADRLPLIMQAQPEGPYRLFGNCVGGVVAFEVARLLIAAGKKVELVIMMDPPTVSGNRAAQMLLATMRRVRPIADHAVDLAMAWTYLRCADLQKFSNISWTRRWAAISTRMRNIASSTQERIAKIVAVKPGVEEEAYQRSSSRPAQKNRAGNAICMCNVELSSKSPCRASCLFFD